MISLCFAEFLRVVCASIGCGSPQGSGKREGRRVLQDGPSRSVPPAGMRGCLLARSVALVQGVSALLRCGAAAFAAGLFATLICDPFAPVSIDCVSFFMIFASDFASVDGIGWLRLASFSIALRLGENG